LPCSELAFETLVQFRMDYLLRMNSSRPPSTRPGTTRISTWSPALVRTLAIFILGKYYKKLDESDVPVIAISTSLISGLPTDSSVPLLISRYTCQFWIPPRLFLGSMRTKGGHSTGVSVQKTCFVVDGECRTSRRTPSAPRRATQATSSPPVNVSIALPHYWIPKLTMTL
jgi:hypothetical protein